MSTDGFYKLIDGELLYAPNFVAGPGYELVKEEKDNYSYPINGWSWFDSEEDALVFYATIEVPIDMPLTIPLDSGMNMGMETPNPGFPEVDTGGFYKPDGLTLMYAPNFVVSSMFELLRSNKDNYEYPIDGWQWFDDEDSAYSFYGLEKPV